MSNPTIVCCECDFEGCAVSEVPPKRKKVTMQEYAHENRYLTSDLQVHRYNMEDTHWQIICPSCHHVHLFVKKARQVPIPYNDTVQAQLDFQQHLKVVPNSGDPHG